MDFVYSGNIIRICGIDMSIIKKEPLFWALDLEMEQPSNEIISIGMAWETPSGIEKKDFLITPSQPLSPFIQELTGLRDNMFDFTSSREACFMQFYREYQKFESLDDRHFKPSLHPITWGQGDLHLLRKQMIDSITVDIDLPRRIVDVKTLLWFDKMAKGDYNSSRMSLNTALKYMNLKFQGNAHNSADDAFNTLIVFRKLLESKQNCRSHLKIILESM